MTECKQEGGKSKILAQAKEFLSVVSGSGFLIQPLPPYQPDDLRPTHDLSGLVCASK